jgi:hypothetical protein
MVEEIASWHVWTYDSTRSEAPRSRLRHVYHTKYPTNRFWVEDLVKDAAKTAKFRYDFKTNEFYILLYKTQVEQGYGLGELAAQFKVKVHNWGEVGEDVEIKSASFVGPDSKWANFEWQNGGDPMKLPRAPPLAPTTPDVMKTSMFGGGGMAHHMYPRVQHISRLHLETPGAHHMYAKVANKSYGHLSSRRLGLPSALPTFSMAAGKDKAKRSAKVSAEKPAY